MLVSNRHIVWFLILLFSPFSLLAQNEHRSVKVDSVVIYCVGTPTQVEVKKTSFRYNKAFAMSFQMDDSHVDIYNTAYQLFGGPSGLTFSDGCGNLKNFSMAAAIYIFNAWNVDLLEDGPYHVPHYLTWAQLTELWRKGWSVANHGATDPVTGDVDYDVRRTQSYARRRISDSLFIKVFVQPNQGDGFAEPARQNNYHGFLGVGLPDALNYDEKGVDVDDPAMDWLTMPKINRLFQGDGYKKVADSLYSRSLRGSHRWMPWGWHTDFTGAFTSELQQIYNTYGSNGLDNIWVTSDEEILDYLAVKQTIQVQTSVEGNKLKLTFGGDVPPDRRYYALTLKLNLDKYIYDVKVYGADDYSFNGVFTDSLLLNLSWDGRYYTPVEQLADSFTTIAVASGSQYDALVAMDYVLQMDCGAKKDSLRDRLCALDWQGWTPGYESGFCDEMALGLGNDTVLLSGECVELSGPDGDYQYYWNDGDTAQTVEVCPDADTLVWLKVTNALGFCKTDTILITLDDFSFSLGNDTSICQGSCLDLIGPEGMPHYEWICADTVFDTVDSVRVCPMDTTQYILKVVSPNGYESSDTIMVNVLPVPAHTLKPDTVINYGDCDSLFGPVGFVDYQWYEGGVLYSTDPNIKVCPVDTVQFVLEMVTATGCQVSDTINYFVVKLEFDLGNDTTICRNDSVVLVGPDGLTIYRWYENDTSNFIADSQSLTVHPLDTTSYILYGEDNVGAYHWDTLTVDVIPLPELSMTYQEACPGENARVVAVPYDAYDMYIWNYNGMTDTTSIGVKVFVPVTPQYIKVEVVDAWGCRNRDSVFGDVLPIPELIAPNDTAVCLYDTVLLSAMGDGSIWWEDTDGNVLSDSSLLSLEVLEDALYIVKDTSEAGCLVSDTVSVDQLDLPNITISPENPEVCKHTMVVLKGNGGEEYWWTFEGVEIYADTLSFAAVDTLDVFLKGLSDVGCYNYDTTTVFVKPSPEVMAWGLLPAYCENDAPDTLYGLPEGGFFTGDGVEGVLFNPLLAGGGTHKVKYAFTNEEGCTGYDTLTTKVYESGNEIDLGGQDTLRPGDTLVLDAGEGFEQYFWNTGDTTRRVKIAYEDYPVGLKVFTVVGVVHGCSSTGEKEVLFLDVSGVEEKEKGDFTLFPNPSSGMVTVRLKGVLTEASLKVYDLTGKTVFTKVLKHGSSDLSMKENLDLSFLHQGIYLVELKSNKVHYFKKLIRSK